MEKILTLLYFNFATPTNKIAVVIKTQNQNIELLPWLPRTIPHTLLKFVIILLYFISTFRLQMKRVWFLFKIIESILGLCCLGYHARGFLNINYIQDHYTYVVVFGGFTLMAMFGCLSICLKEPVSALREGTLNTIAAMAFIFVSMNSMYHAEKDFHLMYLSAETSYGLGEEHLEEEELTKQPHPFFKYSKAQSVAALCCGSLFLLHAILAFDLAISASDESSGESDEESSTDDVSFGHIGAVEHLPFYVLGKQIHQWLNRYEWFNVLADEMIVAKDEVLLEVISPHSTDLICVFESLTK